MANALWIELRKARRSRVPLFTFLGFLMLPLVCALLMVIYKDPEFARNVGLISAKANLVGGSADWPFYLSMFAQGIAIGGILLFSLIATWVFGREFADGTLKDLLAVPVSRTTILLAKFIVVALWSLALTVTVYLVGLVLGAVVGLPQGTGELLVQGSTTLVVAACLVIVVVMPVALLASVGRGYLMPMGIMLLILALANVVGLLGWGSYFPWSVPGLYAQLGGQGTSLEPASYVIVLLTGLAGMFGTFWWWKVADQSR
ncbi:MAG: bacitracin ABC transporter permease [Planctomycetaceae bacterium]|nr:MAG: bacitracin ABC transporter permease [Planctomycetaceae bacterium]